MDENDFMKAFAGVDLLQVEAVSETIGRVIAKLHEGMISGGMTEWAALNVISSAMKILFESMSEIAMRENARNNS